METRRVVSREEWLTARKAHLANEKAHTRAHDKLREERRALPWVKVEKNYAFETEQGPKTLPDLFDGRGQLIVYHFMFGPGWKEGCDGCSFISDHIDGANLHLAHHDVTLLAVSRAPLKEFLPFKKRMRWRFPWVSSTGSDFNYDFGVAFTSEQVAKGKPLYNYGTTAYLKEYLHGLGVFVKDAAGDMFHTYSTYARGGDILLGAHNFLDMTPRGRDEDGVMSWVRLHDAYENANEAPCPSRAE